MRGRARRDRDLRLPAPPEPARGLDFISKLNTWVFRYKDREGEVQVRESVVPRRKRQGGEGGMRTLDSDEYEVEKERVTCVVLKWAETLEEELGTPRA